VKPAAKGAEPESARECYRRTLLELARADPRIFCVDTDMGGLEDGFGAELPGQYVNLGIAEANMMGVCAGLAVAGLIPFANTMSIFAVTRACEQMRTDIAANNLPVRVVVTHGGLSAGHYGPSHHALEDLAIARALPNLTVIVPADAAETMNAVRAAAYHDGPVFVRLGRGPTAPLHHRPYEFTIGGAVTMAEGDDVTLIATGPLPVAFALWAGQELARAGVSARVLDMHTVRPLDTSAVLRAARETRGIVTVEDHISAGGLGGAVCEVVAGGHPCPVRRIGAESALVDSVGSERELLEEVSVTPERIVFEALRLVRTAIPRCRSSNFPGNEERDAGESVPGM
jgi:transketolase